MKTAADLQSGFLDDKYGAGNRKTAPAAEHNQIKNTVAELLIESGRSRMFTLNSVYVICHTRADALGHENDKCPGVLSSSEGVEKAKACALKQKGLKVIPTVSLLLGTKSQTGVVGKFW